MQFPGMLKRRLWLSVLAGAAIFLSACGGGGEGGSVEDPGGNPDPGTGMYSAAQRISATDRIADKFEQLAASGGADTATWTQLRDWVLTQPEFMAAGVGERTLWAQFKDGRYFLYTDNWRALPDGSSVQTKRSAPAAVSATGEIPGSADALVLGFTGEEFEAGAGAMSQMSRALRERGWKVGQNTALTVEALKSGGQLGFLFLTSHSGQLGPEGKKEFAVMTETEVTVANELGYLADLRDGSLIYHRDRTNWQRFGLSKSPRYAVTAAFVNKYLRFSPNSLVIMLSCNSGSAQASGFHAALQKQNAGSIIGWDGPSNAYAFKAMDLMVDRLTGMNEVQPVTPANRAFSMPDVWAYLGKKNLLVTPPLPGDTPTPVRLVGNGFSRLNPVISQLQAMGDKLTIHGEFGTEPGSVTVGGVPVAPIWSADGRKIEALLGNATHGEVVVTARGRKSNPRILASWNGQLTYTHEEEAVSNCSTRFRTAAVIDLHLRADAHGIRDEVDGPVKNNPQLLTPAPDTLANWTASGECIADGLLHTRWSGKGAFRFEPYFDFENGQIPTGNIMVARMDANEQRFQIYGVFGQHERYQKTEFSEDQVTQQPLYFDRELAGFVNHNGSDASLLPHGTFLPFDARQNVGAKQQRMAHDVLPYSLEVKWGAMQPSPSFDEKIGR